MKKNFEMMKSKGSKRIIENAVILLILLVILIIVINSTYDSTDDSNAIPTAVITEKENTYSLEERLEKILGMISGAGNVNIMISYVSSEEKIPIYDVSQNNTVTEEKDKEGGTRKTESKNTEQKIVFEEMGNAKQPFIKQINTPKVIGVIVVADGASNLKVKEDIINAVSAIVDVPQHRIQVFSRRN